jgi:hypothetical protein
MMVTRCNSANHAYLKADSAHFGRQIYRIYFPGLMSHRYGLSNLSMHISLETPDNPSALASATYCDDDAQIARGVNSCANSLAAMLDSRMGCCLPMPTLDQIEFPLLQIVRHLELEYERPPLGVDGCERHGGSVETHARAGKVRSADGDLALDKQSRNTQLNRAEETQEDAPTVLEA